MPGLIGIVWNKRMDEKLLDKMADSMKHESWHRVDKYTDSFFSTARVSLGIFNAEPQPISNEDRAICIFMYGKIYLPNKRSYIDLNEWLRLNEKWQEFVTGLLLDDKAHSSGYFNKDYIEILIKEHQAGKVDHSGRLAYLATFRLFLRMFFDN